MGINQRVRSLLGQQKPQKARKRKKERRKERERERERKKGNFFKKNKMI